ncbi:MAG: UDP-N-acetylmuramoyl-tripeptide--D-alanyl-D-alanine ligase [Synergistales bacterium]|nr:UDP-N-acetylmuramoyl-tripeptide--D-alanyl-D-alanine ligase [Synergistales bacterium]
MKRETEGCSAVLGFEGADGLEVSGCSRDYPDRWCSDSRDCREGSCFVALPGEKRDGHEYIDDALEHGAAWVMLSKSRYKEYAYLESEVCLLSAEDTLEALIALAKRRLSALALKHVIAVTGSVGKTTTRMMIARLLQRRYRVYQARGSFNTAIGCALTILEAPEDIDILVLEMGANRPGEIRELVTLFPPDIAFLTEVAAAHLKGFSDIQGVCRAKMEITESQALGAFFYNADNQTIAQHLENPLPGARMVPVGREAGSDGVAIGAAQFVCDETGLGLAVELTHRRQRMPLRSSLYGEHHAYTVAFGVGCALWLRVPVDDIRSELERIAPLPGRGRYAFGPGRQLVIDESYNANPASMKASVGSARRVVDQCGFNRLVAVLGGMGELGTSASALHEQVLQESVLGNVDVLVLVGDEWRSCRSFQEAAGARLRFADNAEEAAELVEGCLDAGDVLLIKGSNVYHLSAVAAPYFEEQESPVQ